MPDQKIKTFLWYDTQAEEAARLYTSIFKNSRILSTLPGPGGTVMTVTFELDGREYIALNGGPMFKFTEAVSLFVDCETQAEVDEYWDKLIADGGSPSQCGWLKDKFGLSWQIIPRKLMEYVGGEDRARAKRVMDAMLQMVKIDIAALDRAAQS